MKVVNEWAGQMFFLLAVSSADVSIKNYMSFGSVLALRGFSFHLNAGSFLLCLL